MGDREKMTVRKTGKKVDERSRRGKNRGETLIGHPELSKSLQPSERHPGTLPLPFGRSMKSRISL